MLLEDRNLPPAPLRHRYGEVIMPLPVRTCSEPGGGFFVAEKENVCSFKKSVIFSLEEYSKRGFLA